MLQLNNTDENINIDRINAVFVNRILERFNVNGTQPQKLVRRPVNLKLNEDDEVFCETERQCEKQKFNYAVLNRGQATIYNHLMANTNDICLIQAGPGCGKSFVLKTIAFHHPTANFESIIYKKDLLIGYRYCTRRFTVARFMMRLLTLNFKNYQALERALSYSLSTFDFMMCLIKLLQRSKLPDFQGSVVFLDEYSVMSKSFLVIILTLFERNGVGAIVCGDRNQLQNIHNSKHSLLSSYDLASSFATKTFNLELNERCSDKDYNALVNEFAQYSSSDKLSDYTYSMLAALFPQQCIDKNNYHNIHLAATHNELSHLAHVFVCTNQYETSFYTINQSNIRIECIKKENEANNSCMRMTEAMNMYMANQGTMVGKFLPYLPLVVGGQYYVGIHSESSIGILEVITEHFLIVRMVTNTHIKQNEQQSQKRGGGNSTLSDNLPSGVLATLVTDEDIQQYNLNQMRIKIVRTNCDKVMFEQHREYLMETNPGHLYNFPIYPTNFMSMHKCQGCTITNNVDLILSNTTYQGLYVALSRVTNPKQIARIVIRDQISNLASAIVNIEELVHTNNVHVDIVRDRMRRNYIKYMVSQSDFNRIANLIIKFLELNAGDPQRQSVRMDLVQALNNSNTPRYLLPKPNENKIAASSVSDNTDDVNKNSAIYKFVQYRQVFLGLSKIPSTVNQCVWLHEFLKRQPNELELILDAKQGGGRRPQQDTATNLKNYDDDEIDESGLVAVAPKDRICDFERVQYNFQMDRVATTIVNLCELKSTPAQSEDIRAYIQFTSATKLRADTAEIQKYQQTRCVERINDLHYLENDEFACRVYHLYRRDMADSVITIEWLIDQLNDMMETCKNVEPTNQPTTLKPHEKKPEPLVAHRKQVAAMMKRRQTKKRPHANPNDIDPNISKRNHKYTMDAITDAKIESSKPRVEPT